ncbi:M23 family metallopeptidase [Actinokineospora guangxiensis]|uniref:M23 family metallopeptidase n=1 Tax=Actinokineospora guangxiensis TaxID=1490288 RepID=A0ABW0ESI6_9PSEU
MVVDVVSGGLAYGGCVVVTHGDGTMTRYAHLATMARGAGESMAVSRGTRIGTVGGSGGHYAPHLHYQQIAAGGAIDASPTVEGSLSPLGTPTTRPARRPSVRSQRHNATLSTRDAVDPDLREVRSIAEHHGVLGVPAMRRSPQVRM